jgi:ParB/RepB/Spo0J family partition protein
MENTVINATEYRDLPLSLLTESKTNPRKVFNDAVLQELASSIRSRGVLSPLLVRPLTENGFEIVAGARRYRAAQMADVATVPVRIVHPTDAEVIEAQLVENLIRAEIHPMEEAEGFARLLALEEPKYSIEQIADRVGKQPSFVASRMKLIDLVPAAVDAFYANEIGVGHALLLAKLPSDLQQQALSACFKEVYNNGAKPARILLPTHHKVCANPACPIHHPKKASTACTSDTQFKVEQEKWRREQPIANATGLRVLSAIGAAVPVRLMKRDLLFVAERLANLLDENRCAILAKQHGIKKAKDNDSIDKLFAAFLRHADEGTLGRAVIEAVILITASRGNAAQVLRDAATAYKVDTDAIAAKVKQEFAAKKKREASKKIAEKSSSRPAKKAAA